MKKLHHQFASWSWSSVVKVIVIVNVKVNVKVKVKKSWPSKKMSNFLYPFQNLFLPLHRQNNNQTSNLTYDKK